MEDKIMYCVCQRGGSNKYKTHINRPVKNFFHWKNYLQLFF
jgi:hypothetical protein